MEQSITNLLTPDLLSEVATDFGIVSALNKLGDFESFVFEGKRNDGKVYILRITHDTHRSKADIESELDWVSYLHEKGISVPAVYGAVRQYLTHNGSSFFACLFSKVNGKGISLHSEEFNESLFELWGRTIATIHEATYNYLPGLGIQKRPNWDEDNLLNIECYIPEEEMEVVASTKELVEQLKEFPTNRDVFNLIHGDIHSGNFFYDGQNIHVFDFDDASYHWLVSDLAIPAYYSVFYRNFTEQADKNAYAKQFLGALVRGYTSVRTLPPYWKETMPYMLRLRDVTLYSVLHKKISPEDRNERITTMLKELRERIEARIPLFYI